MLPGLGLLLVLAASPADDTAWRLSAEPSDAAETALREAAAHEGVDALRALASQSPEPDVRGLAHLGAGLRLLDLRRPAEALAELSHAEVQQTLLRDRALYAAAQAQEALGQTQAAVRSYLAAAAEPSSAVACSALPTAAAFLVKAGQPGDAVGPLEQVVAACPADAPAALLALGDAQLARGDRAAAAAAYDRLDRELPASALAAQARLKLAALADQLPARAADESARRSLARGMTLLAAGRSSEAIAALHAVQVGGLPAAEAQLVQVSLGQALMTRGRTREAAALLQKIPADSPHAAQAAFLLARERARRLRTPEAFETVADRYRGSPWGEESLLALANHYQKDARDDDALPWWRRLLAEYPEGRYVERAAWRVAWADYRAGRFEAAAQTLETTARLRAASSATPACLYWAARARLALGQNDRARALLQETVRRYKYAYHGLRAREWLARLGGGTEPGSALSADGPSDEQPLPEPRGTRVRLLLLLDRLDEATEELRLCPETSRVLATIAWLDWRRGRLRPALVEMKRAYPEWVSEAGDRLPVGVWHVLFPLRYESELRAAADVESLDASLVAAVILQESTFDAAALSRAGARGLMQVMPATGRRLAHAKGVRFRRAALHDPGTSLDFGTRYLRQMNDRYAGAVEKVLAAYNAGPHRVDAWTAERGERSAEEFIESIPFTETRQYVTTILASREHYRRIYGLGKLAPGPVSQGAKP